MITMEPASPASGAARTTAAVAQGEPLAVSPNTACRMLDIGMTRLYALIAAGEVEAYKQGRSRKITTRSIYAYHERLIAEAAKTSKTR